MKRRVVITGAGVISAIGNDMSQTLDQLKKGQSGIGAVRYLNTQHHEYPVGEVKLSNDQLKQRLDLPQHRQVSRTTLLGITALKEALAGACLSSQSLALVSGTTVAGMDITEGVYPDALTKEVISRHDCGGNTNEIADYFGVFDFTTTSSTACSSALNAIIFGVRLIQSGLRDIVVVGGTESLSRFHLNGFKSLMILDESPCKPFDAHRKGLNLGEGAAYLVLECEQSARRRGVTQLGVIAGVGNSCDAFHQTASSADGEGAYLAMTKALTSAGLMPEDIDYINAHGTATPNNDASESEALRRVFGNHLPPVSSTKGLTGHTTSACGSIEAVFSLLALHHQFIPGNVGFASPDPECIIPYIGGDEQPRLRYVACNAFGFGGNDSTIILGTYGE